MDVTITVLGPVGARRGEEAIDPGPRQRRLLAGLTLAAGDMVPSDRLVDIIWGDNPPRSADRSLKTYVTRLRRTLVGDDANPIEFRSHGYVLDPSLVAIDSEDFETAADEAERRFRIGDYDDALALLQSAIGRWQGSAYQEFAHEEWARPVAVRLEERRIEARQALVRTLVAVGLTERAVGEGRALVDAEPFREGAAEVLMRALHADGRTAEALRVLPDLRAKLAEAVGLEPSPRLLEVESRIATGQIGTAPVGRTLRGYELLERVGQGTHAYVHRAIQLGVGREVAVKVIRPELADQADFIRRFEHEAQLVARVEHPHVVPIHDFWREPGAAYLVMRFMRGGSLEELLHRSGPLKPERVSVLADQVGGALARAHQCGVVHRDVRPANILLDEEGSGFLADFGIARMTSDDESLPIVSPGHAAPEVLKGRPAGVASDVLSFGMTVFELLAGHSPFSDSTDRAELIRRQINEPLPSLRSQRSELSAEVDVVLARATAKNPSDRHASVEVLVHQLMEALDRSSTPSLSITGDSEQPTENPYVGLRTFDEADAGRFFGRDEVTASVIERLGEHRFVTVVGPSGSGKSSAVRAGVLPNIRKGALPESANWFVTTMVPGAAPYEALEAALLRVAVNPPSSLGESLQAEHGIARAIRRTLPTDDGVVFLLIDQLEELFTLTDRDECVAFLDQICAAVTDSDRLRVVATIRADHLDGPLGVRSLASMMQDGMVTVGPMSAQGLEQAIVKPARMADVEVDRALVAELVGASIDRPSVLPLLQYALAEIFDERISGVMTLAAYERIGGITGALGDRAESLVPSAEDRRLARDVFSRLMTVPAAGEATRRRAKRAEFGDDRKTAACLKSFGEARLLSFDHDAVSREPTVEVAHEALLTSWSRLADWTEADRDDLRTLKRVTESSQIYQAGENDPSDLARGPFLIQAQDLHVRRPELLSETERTWIDHSIEAEDLERRAVEAAAESQIQLNSRLRRLLQVVAALLFVAVAASVVAFILRGQAVDNADEAERISEQADIERLVAESASELNNSPDRGILLALEAYRRADTPTTRGALFRAINDEPRLVGVTPVVLGPSRIDLNATGDVAVAWSTTENGRWVRFDPSTGDLLGPIETASSGVWAAGISGDGATIVLGPNNGGLVVAKDGGRREIDYDGSVLAVEVDDAGKRALISSPAHVALVDLESGTELWRYRADPETEFLDVFHALSSDGELAAVQIGDFLSDNIEETTVLLLDPDGNEVQRIDEHRASMQVAFGPNGKQLITAGLDRRIMSHDLIGDSAPVSTSFNANVANNIVIGADGLIALAQNNGALSFWTTDLIARGSVSLPALINSLAVTPDGMVRAALDNGEVWTFDPNREVVTSQAFATDFAHIPTAGGIFDTPNETFESTIVRRLTDGEELAEVGFPDPFDSYGDRPRFSPNGQWVQAYDAWIQLTGIGEVFGDRRYLVVLNDISQSLISADYVRGENWIAVRPDDDGRLFALTGLPGNAAAGWFDPATGELLAGPAPLSTPGTPLLLSDGSVMIGDDLGSLIVLNPTLDAPPRVVVERSGFVPHYQHRDGRVIAGDSDGVVLLVDLDSGVLTELVGLEGGVQDALISPDGRLAVAGTMDSLALFDLTTNTMIGRPIAVPRANGTPPGMSWTEDSRSVWINTATGPQRIDVHPDSWFERACAIVNRTLTVEEWRAFVSAEGEPIDSCS